VSRKPPRIGAAAAALVVLSAALALAACGVRKPPTELTQARRLEKRGDDAGALASYDGAVAVCARLREPAERLKVCAQAMSGRAFTLERLGRADEATRAWLDMAKALADSPDDAGRALHEAALLELRRGHDKPAYDLFWRVIVEHPDSTAADDSLRVVVRDGRRRNPRELDGVLAQLWQREQASELGDNLLQARADLAEHELGDARAAIDHWDQLAAHYPKGSLFDDALWNAARLARAGGDPKGALVRLRKLLATREEAFMIGSYHSVFLDDAQLELGRILRDDLGDARAALGEFTQLPKDYPDSVLRDDALWELATTQAALADAKAACATLAALAKQYPDSKYLLDDEGAARALATRLGCAR
jgi:tetratricopeptide (TPR) repeat protein